MRNAHFSRLNNLNKLICGHIRKFVMLSIIFWTIIFFYLAQSCIEKNEYILIDTNCTPLVADLFLFCYQIDFVLSLSDNNQADVIKDVIDATSRYLDDLLNIDKSLFRRNCKSDISP